MDLSLPNLHPAIVHFPIVLIPLALVIDIVSLLWRRQSWRHAGGVFWGVAAAATAVAFVAGRSAADGLVGLIPRVQPALNAHADWAAWTLGVVTITAVVRALLAAAPWPGVVKIGRAAVLLAGAVLLAMLFWTADLGGALVYRHAVAVATPDCPACEPETAEPAPSASSPAGLDESGVWQPDPTSILASGGRPWPAAGSSTVVDGTQTVLLPNDASDMQVNVWFDLTYFEGRVEVLHNVDGTTSGSFSVDRDGTAALISSRPEPKVLASGRAEISGRVALSVSAVGGHFKGMVDGRTVVHGHGAEYPVGQAGIRLTGRGVVGIERLEVVDLSP